MKKNAARGMIVVIAALAVFAVMAFAIPFAHTAVFWVAFGFGVASILFQIYIFRLAQTAGGDAQSRFYGFPIARVGVIYLIAQLIASVIEMALARVIPAAAPSVRAAFWPC